MKIGISQLILPDLSHEEFFAKSAAAGYEAAELVMRKEGKLSPATDASGRRKIIKAAEREGIELVSMVMSHVSGNLLACGDDQRKGIQETLAGLKAASDMGIECLLHTLGWLSADLFYEDAYANTVRALKHIAPEAERLGVTLALEFVWNGFLFSPLEVRRLCDEIGSERVGFYFDPGNMAVFQFPQHWVRAIGHHLKMVHMKDWKGRALNGGWTALLEGEVDFRAVMKELRAIGYNGPLISEVEPSLATLEDTAKAIRAIAAM